MAGPRSIASIELGSTCIRVLVGEVREDGHLMITGVGEKPSRGVRKGEIVHFDHALSCVKSAIEEAEAQSRIGVEDIYLAVSGSDISGLVHRGSVPVARGDGVIGEDDVEHVVDTAKAVNLPPDRQILHTIQQHFYVDDQPGVVDPGGMEGAKLSVDVLLIHGVRNRMRNTVRVVRSAQVDAADVAFSGLCSALAVLTPEQKESGVMVIDLGGGTTEFFVYADKAVALGGSIAVGGDHITNDLALGLRIPTIQAERLKAQHGSAMVDLSQRGHSIPIPADGGFAGRHVNHVDVQHIIHARMDEMLAMIRKHLEERDLLHVLGAGIVLTGGGAHLRRVAELAEKTFRVPCSVGKPRNVSGLAVVTEGPEYATGIGMLRYALRSGRQSSPGIPFASWFKSLFGR